jgi:hypothetical protein
MKALFQSLFSLFSKKHHFDDIDKLKEIDTILTRANKLDKTEDSFTLSNGDTLVDNDNVIVMGWHIYCNPQQLREVLEGVPKYLARIRVESSTDIDVYGNEIKYFREEYRFTIESDKTNVFIFTFETAEMV